MPEITIINDNNNDLMEEVTLMSDGNNVPNQVDGKEINMPIYHYIEINKVVNDMGEEENVFTRSIDTELIGWRWDAYHKSLTESRPIEGIFALDMGNYVPHLLQVAADRGVRFTVRVMDHKTMLLRNMEEVKSRLLKSNFHTSNATHTFAIRFWNEAEGEWTLAPLNLEADYTGKIGKRFAELFRFTANYITLSNEDVIMTDADGIKMIISRPELVVESFETPEGDAVALYDGANAISPRLARKLGFRGQRGQLRLITPLGLIKGDFVVSPNLGITDVRYHVENLKPELRTTDGRVQVTLTGHAPTHVLNMSVQAIEMNPAVFTAGRVKNDIMAMHTQAIEMIESGEIPAWMDITATAHTDGIDVEEADYTENFRRWQAAGFDLRAAQFFANTAYNVLKSRISNGWDQTAGAYKRFPVPVTNAMSGAVYTYAALTKLAGVVLSEGVDTSVVNVIPGFGVIIPDNRAEDILSILGGGDLDDTIGVILVKIYGSELAVTNLVADGALNPSIEVPTTSADAIEVGYIIRYPNGAGEFVIEPIGNIGFYNSSANVQTICLDDVQRGVRHLVDSVNVLPITKTEFSFGNSFARKDALAMFEVQINNPGIGRLAYASQLWCDAVGVSFPDVITGTFEDHVDGVQQGADGLVQLATLEEGYNYMITLADRIIADPSIKVDRALFNVCGKWIRGTEDRPEMDEVANVIGGALHDGIYTQASKLMQVVYKDIHEKVARRTLEAKANSNMAKVFSTVLVGQDARMYAESFTSTWEAHFREIDSTFKRYDSDNAFIKSAKRYARSTAYSNAVDKMMAQLAAKEDRFVLAVYKLTFQPLKKFGQVFPARWDGICFQSNKQGESISDLIVAALHRAGITEA